MEKKQEQPPDRNSSTSALTRKDEDTWKTHRRIRHDQARASNKEESGVTRRKEGSRLAGKDKMSGKEGTIGPSDSETSDVGPPCTALPASRSTTPDCLRPGRPRDGKKGHFHRDSRYVKDKTRMDCNSHFLQKKKENGTVTDGDAWRDTVLTISSRRHRDDSWSQRIGRPG